MRCLDADEEAVRKPILEFFKSSSEFGRFQLCGAIRLIQKDSSLLSLANERNILNQVFDTDQPNQKWVTDVTYLPLVNGFVYLAVVLDLFGRKVVGWELSDSLATPLVSDALRHAIEKRSPETSGLLIHSDRGCQYTSDEYQSQLKTMNITCSMSRTGCCYDNAVMERFFWSLKNEWTKFASFEDIDQARESVFKYIETFYNSKRIHQSLEYLTPNQFELNFEQQTAA